MFKGPVPFHQWLVGLRRHFHQFPELSYQEVKTASKIAEVLAELGVPFQTKVGGNGLIARLIAARPGPTLGFRADMDALPLHEQNEVDYRSRNQGVMHACGHDAHVAIALGVIRCLIESGWREKGAGKILFFFQPAEEKGSGAKLMIDTGILDAEPLEAIFAGHMHPELPVGEIGLAPEMSNASPDSFEIRLTGKGGHGAHPHLCIDPIVAGAHLVVQMQTIVSRSLPPLDSVVLTVGRFQAGSAPNIIPQEAVLEGTLRTLTPESRDIVLRRLDEMLRGIEAAFGVTARLKVDAGCPVLVNNPRIVDYTVRQAGALLGARHVHMEAPRMGAEDFAYFLQRCPGVLVRVGCHDREKGYMHGLHSPYFDIDEGVLDVGSRLFAQLLANYTSEEDRSAGGRRTS